MIGQQVQSYRILRQLGAGGMGVVYEAEDTRLGRRVALKFLPSSIDDSPDALARFEREARILSSLNHPNICTIHDVGTTTGDGRERRFIVMELLEGETLRSRMHGHTSPIELVLNVGTQIAEALDAAHDKGIVHRDIKPANIFINKRGQAKLLDFGVAKPGADTGGADDETRALAEQLTTPGTTIGSINYMSPEQARGHEIDGRSDLFSLGAVLYEIATGGQAFGGPTSAVVYDAILNRQPPPASSLNPEVPPDFDRIITRLLEKDAGLRYQTAGDLVAELRRIRRDGSATAPTASGASSGVRVPPAPVAAPDRRPRRALLAIPVAIVLGAAGFWIWQSTRARAFTERDLVLVADFANTTGEPVFDDALKQAVSVQLQQTAFVTLLAEQQVQTTLGLMRRSPEEPVIGTVAREVCQRAGARATVEGSIAPLGSSYVIALGVRDCKNGAAIAQEQTQADTKETVLKAVGAAVTSLRKRLGESLASVAKNDVPAEATTSSLEALRAYGQAQHIRATKPDDAAIPFFQQAIDKDPSFALAHARLGIVYSNLGRTAEAKASLRKAFDLRDRVSDYERLYIQWAFYARGEPDEAKAKQALDLLTTQYPRDFASRNNLGFFYSNKGQFREAVEQYRVAHELAPAEPLLAQNLSSVLFNLGQYEEAMALADLALSMRPTPSTATNRWVRAHLQFDPREAEFKDVAVKQASPESVLQNEMTLALWDGRIADYSASSRTRIESLRSSKRDDAVASTEADRQINIAVFERGQAVDALKKAVAAPSASRQFVTQAAIALAVTGDSSVLRREIARIERDEAPPSGARPSTTLVLARAYALSADGKTAQAVAALQAITTGDPRQASLYLSVGQFQERGGLTDDAIASYRRVIDAAPALAANANVPFARLALARLLAAKGDMVGAKTQCDILAKQWAHADATFLVAKELKTIVK